MFSRRPPAAPKAIPPSTGSSASITKEASDASPSSTPSGASASISRKRSQPLSLSPIKRSKSSAPNPGATASGQKTLAGFFKPKSTGNSTASLAPSESPKVSQNASASSATDGADLDVSSTPTENAPASSAELSRGDLTPSKLGGDTVIDPIVSKQDWGKLFTKKPVPKCDGHQEPCISLTTKKPGMNQGRAFWICPRPLGPSGEKEKGTQWRCATFIWSSDWNSSASTEP